jgi:D-glutamate cyclase
MPGDLELCRVVGESVDRLISAQVFMSGGAAALTSRNITKELYEAARALQGEPLTYLAARELLERVTPRSAVVICAGFFDPPSMIDEADGPLGAALLARSLCVALDATPVVVTEVANMGRMAQLLQAAGLEVVGLDLARVTPFKAAVMPLPIAPRRAEQVVERIFELAEPSAVVTIEKPSPNVKGAYHTGVGLNVTDLVGKVSFLTGAARRRGVPSIGLGDGGNEVGMGRILEACREILPTGADCGCPCGGGIAAATETDILVVGAVANWASYGIEACLAAALEMPEALHSLAEERRVTEAASRAGLIDPTTGLANGWVDGTPPICSESMLELMRQMVELRLTRRRPGALMNFPKRWAERGVAEQTVEAWARHLAANEDAFFAESRWAR